MRLGKDRHNYRVEFITAAARYLFVSAWADTVRECGGRFAPQAELMDAAPATPDAVMLTAAELLGRLEHANGVCLAVIWERAQLGDDHRREPTLSDFGHYMAAETMGDGSAWTDNHPEVMLPPRLGGADVELVVPCYEIDVMNEYDLVHTLPTAKIRRNFRKGLSE